MQFPQSLRPERRQNSRISTIRFHNLKYLEGNCMRNFSPVDERWPQGLPTRLRTLTVRAFSGCSAKKFARHRAFSGSSAKKFAQHTPVSSISGTKLSRHSRKHPIWALFRVQGDFIHGCGSNKPSGRTSLTNSAAFEAQHTAADLCAHDPAVVVDTGDHRRDRNERKNAHA